MKQEGQEVQAGQQGLAGLAATNAPQPSMCCPASFSRAHAHCRT